MAQETLLEVMTTPEFKERVEHTCQEFHLNYATVVIRLLEEWLNGDIRLDIEPDPEFVASAHEAFRSEQVQQTLKQLGTQYDPTRTYPHALKA
ncbi:MAG: hypothetical protein QME81_14290 [bacterium]|nr:hypothetical protein [bacterium]